MISHLRLVNYLEFQEILDSTIPHVLVVAQVYMSVNTIIYLES